MSSALEPTRQPPPRDAALAPLKYPAFRLLLTSRFASFLGNAVAPIALAFAVLDLSGSPAALGLIVACRTIPQVLLLLFGGVVADRFPRTRVIVVSNSLAAVTQALAAALLLTGNATLWQLGVIEALNGAASAFAFPAGAGLTPQTVPAQALQQANALLRLATNTAVIGGAALGGLVVAIAGSGWALGFDALTFAVAALFTSRIRLLPGDRGAQDADATEAPRSSMLADLREGWQEFISRTWLWVVVVAFAFINAAESGAVGVLGPYVADDTIGRAGWGFVLSALAAGMLCGALIALRLRPRHTLVVGMLGIALMLPFLVAIGVRPTLLLLVPTAFVSGLGMETFGIYWDLSMQQHVPRDVLSRVYSYDALGSLMLIPLGEILAGPLANLVGTQQALLLAAAAIGVATVAALAVPAVRQLERTDA